MLGRQPSLCTNQTLRGVKPICFEQEVAQVRLSSRELSNPDTICSFTECARKYWHHACGQDLQLMPWHTKTTRSSAGRGLPKNVDPFAGRYLMWLQHHATIVHHHFGRSYNVHRAHACAQAAHLLLPASPDQACEHQSLALNMSWTPL